MLADYVRRSHQSDLSKTSKHWDIFLSHCIQTTMEIVLPDKSQQGMREFMVTI